MENVIFPMQTINITQRALDSYSHKGLEAWDIAGADTGIESAYAPCTVKVLAKLPYETTGFSNTVFFGSCDENGNPAKVLTENGQERILTFALTHDNNISDIPIGKIYKSGEKIYDEGTKGKATGNHIHMEIGEGWQYKKAKQSNGVWSIPNIVHIADVFYQLKDWNIIKRLNGYAFKTVDSRTVRPVNDSAQLADAMRAFQHVAGKAALSDPDKHRLDVDGDGDVDLTDAMKLFKNAAGK